MEEESRRREEKIGTGPLGGIRILDLTNVVAGPIATLYLARCGAEIIKIENPRIGGDVNRAAAADGNRCNPRFCTINHNKKSIVLDLASGEGKAIFLKMAEKADAVVENFRPGVMDRLGLGYETLKKVNPRIVYGSISGFGSTDSPYRDRAAYDVIAQAVSGITMLNGEEGDPPVKIGTSIGDVIAGINLAFAVVTALREAERTGKAQRTEVSLVDAMISATMMDNSAYLNGGTVPKRIGNRYREWSPYGIYKAKDGWYALGTGTEEHYRRLAVNVLGHPELTEDPRCASQAVRTEHREVTEAILNAWAAEHTVEEICRILDKEGIPNARVNTIRDTAEDPHFRDIRGLFPSYGQPGVGTVRLTDLPLRYYDCELPGIAPAPEMGEQTDEVLKELADCAEEEIGSLRSRGIVR